MSEFGSVRRGQLVNTYGVGAFAAIDNSSAMVAGIHRWPITEDLELFEPRLQYLLNVQRFFSPPVKNPRKPWWQKDRNVPVIRFPTMHWCPECKRLARFSALAEDLDKAVCSRCDVPLVPSRFVVCCDHGHIDDFPYMKWVHEGDEPTGAHRLSISTSGVSASLSDIQIRCSCGAERTLDGAFSPDAFRGWLWCSGRRPWIGDAQRDCRQIPRTLQRGASNAYFPLTASAISIPPWSEPAQKIIERHWAVFEHAPETALAPMLEGMGIAIGTDYTVDQLAELIVERRSGQLKFPTTEDDLRRQEYWALCHGRKEKSKDQDFVCLPAEGADEVRDLFENVMVVTRLREVRALRGFTRLRPPESGETERIAHLSPGYEGWLPAVEVLGEGVFFKLNQEQLKDWMRANDALHDRIAVLRRNYLRRCTAMGIPPVQSVTPAFVLIHTLAHILIEQWALDSGYPAGSLRERLYCSDDPESPMAGLLIYTASNDSAGSLGGVVARAARGRLRDSILEANKRAQWCSSDPLCIESEGRGVDSLNLAACHACCLLPETSCEHQNMFLDRALVVGTSEHPELGFFRSLPGGE